MRVLVLCLVVSSCSVSERGEEVSHPVAIQVPGGLGLLFDERAGAAFPGSEGTETFCWDRDGNGFYITTGGQMSWIPLRGGEPRLVVEGFRSVRFPDVSDDGVIAFGATQLEGAGEGWEIWFVNEDGSDLRRITAGYDPSWTAGGLYFENYDPGPTIYHYDLDTGEVRRVLDGDSRNYTVECSPSGRYLTFSRAAALMLHSTADGSTRPLTDGTTYDRFASFSPDEEHLMFYRQVSEGETRNWLVHYELATGQERTVPVAEQATPAYAPPPR